MTNKAELVELQGTAENGTFSHQQLLDILKVTRKGIKELLRKQREALNANKS